MAVGEIDLGKPMEEPHQSRRAELCHDGTQIIPERRLAQSGREILQVSFGELIEERSERLQALRVVPLGLDRPDGRWPLAGCGWS